MESTSLFLVAQVVAIGVMAIAYGFAVQRRDIGWVDVGWAAGMGLVSIAYAVLADGFVWRKCLVAGMAVAWSFRLAGYILKRVQNSEEDARYQSLRRRWGQHTNRYALVLFMAESLLITLFSVPFLVVMCNPNPALTGWDIAGVLIWIVAIAGETLSDRQLHRFRSQAENRSRTCREGLGDIA